MGTREWSRLGQKPSVAVYVFRRTRSELCGTMRSSIHIHEETTMAEASQPRHCILRRKQVEARTGLSRSTIYARIKAGTFPAPVSLGPRAVGWIDGDVERWICDRIDGGWSTAKSA